MQEELKKGRSLLGDARHVATLNLSFFFVEIAVAAAFGSVAVFADSVDFLEDASISALLIVSGSWSTMARARLGKVLAGLILAPTAATLVTAWLRFSTDTSPEPVAISLTGAGALAVNAYCAAIFMRHRAGGGSLVKAAFLSARNDTVANAAMIVAGAATAAFPSPWPDLVVGLAIAALNAGAAWEVWEAAVEEQATGTWSPPGGA